MMLERELIGVSVGSRIGMMCLCIVSCCRMWIKGMVIEWED